MGSASLQGSRCPRVAIVILNWNGLGDTLRCIESLDRVNYGNFEVLIIDNGSTDDSEATVRARYPTLRVLQTGSNLGYAGGNNAGIRLVLLDKPDFVLLLNNDTIVDPDFLSELIGAASLNPRGGFFGPAVYALDDPTHVRALGGANWDPKASRFRHLTSDRVSPQESDRQVIRVDYVLGCCFLVRREVFEKIGLFDERYFLCFEETDLCFRGGEVGFLSYAVPSAGVRHKESASFGGPQSPLLHYFMTRNALYWGKRHLPCLDYWRLCLRILRDLCPTVRARPVLLLGRSSAWPEISRILRTFVYSWVELGHRAARHGFLDYLRGRTGDCPAHLRARYAHRGTTRPEA